MPEIKLDDLTAAERNRLRIEQTKRNYGYGVFCAKKFAPSKKKILDK